MKEDKYIGTEKLTQKGSTLKVVGVSHKNKSGAKVYLIECSVCNRDKELYPEHFHSTKGNLEDGKIPCGCSKSRKRSKHEWGVLAKRFCCKKGLVFKGLINYKNGKSKFKTECKSCGSIDNIQLGKIPTHKGCTSCTSARNRELLLKTEQDSIKDFSNIGKLPSYYEYKKIDRLMFEVTCPVCREDIFGQAGLCDGKFTTSGNNLLKGFLPCRCSPFWRLRDEKMMNLIVKSLLGDIEYSYSKFEGFKTKISWNCKTFNHKNTRSIYYLLHKRKSGCSTCNSFNTRGFYENRVKEKDYLYLIKISDGRDTYIKIGRTFNIKSRWSGYKTQGVKVLSVLGIKQDIHKDVFNEEQLFISRNKGLQPETYIDFDGWSECFNEEYEDVLINTFSNIPFKDNL